MIKIKCSAQVSAQKYFKGLCVATLPAFAPLFLSLLFLYKKIKPNKILDFERRKSMFNYYRINISN